VTAADFLARLQALDVHLHVEGGRLRVNAPKGRIDAELAAALVARKDDLLRLLAANAASEPPALVPIPRGDRPLPLSFLQERLWVLDRLTPGLTEYNLAALFTPDGAVDADHLRRAVRRVISRHEILRARFLLDGDAPVVHLAAADDTRIDFTDGRDLTSAQRRQLLDEATAMAVRNPVDLATTAPVRFHVFRTADDRAALLMAAHHIALDAWSFAVLAREIGTEYSTVMAGRPSSAPPRLQYADFAYWQRRMVEHPTALAKLAYWKTRLAGLPQFSVFPPDRTSAEAGTQGMTHDFVWSDSTYRAVRAIARESEATTYMVVVAAVAAVLCRHTGQTDLAIGSPIGTREHAALEHVIGPILNPIVLRVDLSDDPTFAQLVGRAREALLEGHEHQDVPFERIVQELNPERSLRHSPLFQVAVVQHNAPDASSLQLVGGGAIYDLTLFATERDHTLAGSYEYRSDLYEVATIARIATHVENVVRAAAADSSLRISELPLLGGDERTLVTSTFNDTRAEVDRATLVDQFTRVAAAHRDNVAVDAVDGILTYGELDRLSSALAAQLRNGGAGPGHFVALATDRTSALAVASLGILKSGAAYVPVDLSYPAERVEFMLRDSGAQLIVTSRALVSALPTMETGTAVLIMEDVAPVSDATATRGPSFPSPAGADPAYLIYTSGSSGTPKGVLVPHAAVSNFLAGMHRLLGVSPADALLSVTTPSFDISVLELFLPLVHGARVIVADRATVTDGRLLAERLASSSATMLQSTPSGWRLLMNAGWPGNPSLCAIVGGETLPASLAEWLRPRVRTLWNAYGPTETTVWSTMARLGETDPVTIGTPIVNTRVYVVDARLQPVPIGAPGEIYLAGDGLALGYHQRPELTAERFVPEPAVPGGRMYRTGDVGRWRADGRLEHLGRIDDQVKVRGYRIELGEIEACLASHDAVKQAVVGVRGATGEDPRLVAWVQLRDDEDLTVSELRRHLRQHVPEFSVPSLIVTVETFPLTPNGKIDRRALEESFAPVPPPRDTSPPSTPTEVAIADIWRRLLGVERVGVSDGFFDLGGHSLLAMRAAHEISEKMHCAIEPRLLFFRTLGQLAATVDAWSGEMAARPS
jgi:amino acid adenylation domain-containing protein